MQYYEACRKNLILSVSINILNRKLNFERNHIQEFKKCCHFQNHTAIDVRYVMLAELAVLYFVPVKWRCQVQQLFALLTSPPSH